MCTSSCGAVRRKVNYHPEDIAHTEEMLQKNGLFPTIMVDCSHGNSNKDYQKQPEVLESVVDQMVAGNSSISGVMIESNLEAGNQKIAADLCQLKYGVSITDACIDWATTERILLDAHKQAAQEEIACTRVKGDPSPYSYISCMPFRPTLP